MKLLASLSIVASANYTYSDDDGYDNYPGEVCGVGNDINPAGDDVTFEECRALCDADYLCNAWSYVPDQEFLPCWIKTECGTRTTDYPNSFSASKQTDVCAVNAEERISCQRTDGSTTKESCESIGCCWDDSIQTAFWCFNRVREAPSADTVVGPLNAPFNAGQYLAEGVTVFETWEFSMDFRAEENEFGGHQQLLGIAQGGPGTQQCWTQPGCRLPGFFIEPNSKQFVVYYDIEGSINQSFGDGNPAFNLDNNMHSLLVKQEQVGNSYFFSVTIDGTEVFNQQNTPTIFTDVSIATIPDNTYMQASGHYENLVFATRQIYTVDPTFADCWDACGEGLCEDTCGANGYCCAGTSILGDGTCTPMQPSIRHATELTTHMCVTKAVPPTTQEAGEPVINSCNNANGEMELDLCIKGITQAPDENWYLNNDDGGYYRTVAANDTSLIREFTQDEDGNDVLKLSFSTSNTDELCETVVLNGIEVCMEAFEASYMFTCVYDLGDQTLEQDVTVGVNVVTEVGVAAESTGTINYELTVDNENVVMGETVNFTVRPKNPDIVFATVKSCAVKFGDEEIKIFGYSKDMCYLEEAGAAWTTSASDTGNISGSWRAFQWVSNGLSSSEDQKLSCLIGLSQEQSTETTDKCEL